MIPIEEAIRKNTSEILTEEDLRELVNTKNLSQITAYCGYETSGPVHIGHLVTIMKLKQLIDAGIHVKVLFADYHTYLNRKGDWEQIHSQGRRWEETFRQAGLERAEFIYGSSFQRTKEYFDDVLTLSLKTSIKRGIRSMEMVARDFEHAKVSQVIYPIMQAADIKWLGIDIAVGGMEQRKIHALAREILGELTDHAFIAIHTPLIPSLLGEGKMSSSIPESNISMDDTAEEIEHKIRKAHCPAKTIEKNPIIDIARYIVFPYAGSIDIEREERFGGPVRYDTIEALEHAFVSGELHPMDLKRSITTSLIDILRVSR